MVYFSKGIVNDRGIMKSKSKVFLLFFILTFLAESSFRMSIPEGLALYASRPVDMLLPPIFMTAISFLLIHIFNKPRILYYTFFIYWGICVVNFSVRFFRNVNMRFIEVLLLKDVNKIDTDFNNTTLILMWILYGIITIISLYIIGRIIKKMTINNKGRHKLVIASITLFSLLAGIWFNHSFFIQFAVPLEPSPPEYDNRHNSLISSDKSFGVEKIKAKNPNLIIIQSETFWDPSNLGMNFNKEICPNFNEIRNNSINGSLFVPVFGGGTCNTELEVLTGISLKSYYSDFHLIYPNEIKEPTRSLASILRTQGYKTTGYHPFHRSFFNRHEVYNHLGFDEFISLEYMQDAPKCGNGNVTDSYTTDYVLKKIQETKQPLFMMNVTMQNHWPFDKQHIPEHVIHLKNTENLSPISAQRLTNFANGIHVSDRELGRLIVELEKCSEPTIVLFYGDHLPIMGENYKLYREAGYFNKTLTMDNIDNSVNQKKIDFFIWSNIDNQKTKLPTINTYYLPAILLDYMDMVMPEDMGDYLKISYEYPLYTRKKLFKRDGSVETDSDKMQLYKSFLWQYKNIAFSKQVSNNKWIISENKEYNKELNDIKIFYTNQNSIFGKNFYKGVKVLVNEKEVYYKSLKNNEIKLVEKLKRGDEISIILVDSSDKAITQTKYVVK